MPTRSRDIILTDSSRRWLRWIGTWQILGGAFSAIVFLDAIRHFPTYGGFTVVVFGTGAALALLAVGAGYALVQHRVEGILPSLGLQLLQIVGIATNSMMVQIILGPSVALNLVWGVSYQLQAAFRPVLQFHFSPPSVISPGVAVNFLALACFLKLLFLETRRVASEVPPPPDAAKSDAAA